MTDIYSFRCIPKLQIRYEQTELQRCRPKIDRSSNPRTFGHEIASIELTPYSFQFARLYLQDITRNKLIGERPSAEISGRSMEIR